MNAYDYPKNMSVGRVCLELSLKSFKCLEQNYIEDICRELFRQWRELLRYADSCSVLLWTADGSEILDYSGNLDDKLEWARYLGIANPPTKATAHDPTRVSLHSTPRYYMDIPPVITYRDLKRIVTVIKSIGKKVTGLDVTVGETFDPGPEFAKSDFKFSTHKEISFESLSSDSGEIGWIHCTARLHRDSLRYAAYPEGIPEGLHLGSFLGAQFKELAKDLGFDYIWFSNGFGFSQDSWKWIGKCFNGTCFIQGEAESVGIHIIEFWEMFTNAYPGVRVETRGSNLSTGMDIVVHGSPISSIYQFIPFAPPNSPWAALDAQFGLELVGYMSHIAEIPSEGFLFRYYCHDPWWINSPWFDRYNRQPHDIYLPLSITRLDAQLNVTRPFGINLLTTDDSYGNLPQRAAVEIIPYLLDAYSHLPDGPGPVTWVYPWKQYHKLGLNHERAGEVLFGDWFIKSGLDIGLPLNTVISDSCFHEAAQKIAKASIIILPVPDANSVMEEALYISLSAGSSVLLYGSVTNASDRLRQLLGLRLIHESEGEFIINHSLPSDIIKHGNPSDILIHDALLSGGSLNTYLIEDSHVTSLASATGADGTVYAYAVHNPNALSGQLVWLRGSFPALPIISSRLPENIKPSRYFQPAVLLRSMLKCFGISIRFCKHNVNDLYPIVLFIKNKNAYFVTGYTPDTTAAMYLSFPMGAPILLGHDCIVQDNSAHYNLPRWFHSECRVFVKQKVESKISCLVKPSVFPGIDKRMLVNGLVNADVTFLKSPGTIVTLYNPPTGFGDGDKDFFMSTNIEFAEVADNRVICKNISGDLLISWGDGELRSV